VAAGPDEAEALTLSGSVPPLETVKKGFAFLTKGLRQAAAHRLPADFVPCFVGFPHHTQSMFGQIAFLWRNI